MATFRGRIHTGNGYISQDVEVSGVISQSAAKKVMEARYPGAKISAVRIVSSRD